MSMHICSVYVVQPSSSRRCKLQYRQGRHQDTLGRQIERKLTFRGSMKEIMQVGIRGGRRGAQTCDFVTDWEERDENSWIAKQVTRLPVCPHISEPWRDHCPRYEVEGTQIHTRYTYRVTLQVPGTLHFPLRLLTSCSLS